MVSCVCVRSIPARHQRHWHTLVRETWNPLHITRGRAHIKGRTHAGVYTRTQANTRLADRLTQFWTPSVDVSRTKQDSEMASSGERWSYGKWAAGLKAWIPRGRLSKKLLAVLSVFLVVLLAQVPLFKCSSHLQTGLLARLMLVMQIRKQQQNLTHAIWLCCVGLCVCGFFCVGRDIWDRLVKFKLSV